MSSRLSLVTNDDDAPVNSFADTSRSGNVHVIARIRPFHQIEIDNGCQTSVFAVGKPTELNAKEKRDARLGITEKDANAPLSLGGASSIDSDDLLLDELLDENCTYTENFAHTSSIEESITNEPIDADVKQPAEVASKFLIVRQSKNRKLTETVFEFDAVLPPDATQVDVYNSVKGPVQNILRGCKTTVVACGQAATGKSYTVIGPAGSKSQEDSAKLTEHDGLILRAVHDLYDAKQTFAKNGKDLAIELTYIEIHNDKIRDLLADNNHAMRLMDQGSDSGVYVKGIEVATVESIPQIHALLYDAALRRKTAPLKQNRHSSRSHAICTVTTMVKPLDNSSQACVGKLTLVDLPSSERIKETGVKGERRQEAIQNNKDLFTLGKVVLSLSEKSKHRFHWAQKHVPFRDSKLTRLLRDSLGGNCCTLLLACVSPADIHAADSLKTLQYAERVTAIRSASELNDKQSESEDNTSSSFDVQSVTPLSVGSFVDSQVPDDVQMLSAKLDMCNDMLEKLEAKNFDRESRLRASNENVCRIDQLYGELDGLFAKVNACNEKLWKLETHIFEKETSIGIDSAGSFEDIRPANMLLLSHEVDDLLLRLNSCSEQLRYLDLSSCSITVMDKVVDIGQATSANTSCKIIAELDRSDHTLTDLATFEVSDTLESNFITEERNDDHEFVSSNVAPEKDSLMTGIPGLEKEHSTFSDTEDEVQVNDTNQKVEQSVRVVLSEKKDGVSPELHHIQQAQKASECHCEFSVFATNPEHAEFYLPKLAISCECGKEQSVSLVTGTEPSALENILRSWQVTFLHSLSISDAVSFVYSYKHQAAEMAKELFHWRTTRNMTSFRPSLCAVALHVWNRTCQTVIKSIFEQQATGIKKLDRPDLLQVRLATETRKVLMEQRYQKIECIEVSGLS